MRIKKKVLSRLDELLLMADELLKTRKETSFGNYVEKSMKQQWMSLAVSFLVRNLGSSDTYTLNFISIFNTSALNESDRIESALGLLKAVKYEIENDYLFKIEALVSAELFSDFLDNARYLLSMKYKDPAAFLAGAVLEQGLIKVSHFNNVTLKKSENISSLNKKLLQGNVFNSLTHKKVALWNQIRNDADHGNFESYSLEEVDDMIKGIERLLEEYLGFV